MGKGLKCEWKCGEIGESWCDFIIMGHSRNKKKSRRFYFLFKVLEGKAILIVLGKYSLLLLFGLIESKLIKYEQNEEAPRF